MNFLILLGYGLLIWVVTTKGWVVLRMAGEVRTQFPNIYSVRKLYILASLIFVVCIGIKFTHLADSGSEIPNELIAPVVLTPLGEKVLIDLNNPSVSSNPGLSCIVERGCISDLDRINSQIFEDNRFLRNYFKGNENVNEWAKNSSILVNESAAWRGRYIHHYATVLFPLREIRNGNFSYAVTSQYGLISLLPLLLVKKVSFIYYGLISLVVLLTFGLYILFKSRKSSINIILLGTVLLLIVLSTDISALRLSPGFAYFRYLPISILLYELSRQAKLNFKTNYLLWVALALLNSVQFNILFALIAIIWCVLISFRHRMLHSMYAFKMVSCVVIVTMMQLGLLLYQQNSFSPSIFSSVGEAPFSFGYSYKLLALPLALSFWALIFKNSESGDQKFSRDQIILACIIYGACATYAMSFPKSPQHYVGFLIMAFIGVFILMRNVSVSKYGVIFSLITLFFLPLNYHYLSVGKKFKEVKSDFFSYQNQIGAAMYFATAVDVDKISHDYINLARKFQNQEKIYFFSKDKGYIEMANDKNLEPKIYDIYTNLLGISPELAFSKLIKDGVSYLILDNPSKIEYSLAVNRLMEHDFGMIEYQNHQKILLNIQSISHDQRMKLLECNESFCIYKI